MKPLCVCVLRPRPIIDHDANHNQQEFKFNQGHIQGLGREPYSLSRHDTLQVFLVLGEEFLLLQLVFLKGQFLIGNEPAM